MFRELDISFHRVYRVYRVFMGIGIKKKFDKDQKKFS